MFITVPVYSYSRGALRVWKRRRVFRMTAHFRGCYRNTYSNAVRLLHRALRASSVGNKIKHRDRSELHRTRLDAACTQLGLNEQILRNALDRSRIYIAKRTLADLSIWEPRTFKAIAHLGWKRAAEDGLNGVRELGDVPEGIITRGMLK